MPVITLFLYRLTGLGPDGNRYRLSEGHLLTAEPIGSAWEWLTAPG